METLLKVYYTANVGPPSKTTVQFNRISFHNANSCNLISKILFEEFIRGKGERDEKRRRENNKRKKKSHQESEGGTGLVTLFSIMG